MSSIKDVTIPRLTMPYTTDLCEQDASYIKPALITEDDAAKYLNISLNMLRRDRLGIHRIPSLTIGSAVRYSIKSLDEFILRELSVRSAPNSNAVAVARVGKYIRGKPLKQSSYIIKTPTAIKTLFSESGLSERIINAMKIAGIEYVEQAQDLGIERLLEIKNNGNKTAYEIMNW